MLEATSDHLIRTGRSQGQESKPGRRAERREYHSKDADQAAEELRAEIGKGEQKDPQQVKLLKERLLDLVYPAIKKKVAEFLARHSDFLNKNRVTGSSFEDILSKAIEIVLNSKNWASWNREEGVGSGGTKASFVGFIILRKYSTLEGKLVNAYIDAYKTKKRHAKVASLNDPVPGLKDTEFIEVLPDSGQNAVERLIAREDARERLSANRILPKIERVLSDHRYPFSSLFIILYYGLGGKAVTKWIEEYKSTIEDYHKRQLENIEGVDIRKEELADAVYKFLLSWENNGTNSDAATKELLSRIKHGAPLGAREISNLFDGAITHRGIGLKLDRIVGKAGRISDKNSVSGNRALRHRALDGTEADIEEAV